MSLDTGLIVKKTPKGHSFYEINLSTRQTNMVGWHRGMTPIQARREVVKMDKDIAMECGQPYEVICFEKSAKDRKSTLEIIKKLKARNQKVMKKAVWKAVEKSRRKIKTEGKYILKGKKVVKIHDLLEWSKWFEKSRGKSIVEQTTLFNGYWVSTVFLSLDHNFTGKGKPLLFETMVFDSLKANRIEVAMNRYSTYKEAELGHKQLVEKWKTKNLYRIPVFAVANAFRAMKQFFKE